MERADGTQNKGDRGRRWHFAHCEFLEVTRQLFVNGEAVKIESKPLDVLQELLECAPQTVSKDKLIGEAWPNVATSDQSLVTAISKLRRAFGGERESIIASVSGIGYRMAVPVNCVPDEESAPPEFHLEPGQSIPGRENWIAERQLGIGVQQNVWIARHKKTLEARVFKFATNGIRLRALQREVTLSRVFHLKLSSQSGFLRVLDWNFEESPFFIESEYSGLNLYEFAETEDFKRMSLEERVKLAIQLAVQLVDTIAATHGLGILHNDLKPSNILVVPSVVPTQSNGYKATRRQTANGGEDARVHANDPEDLEQPSREWQVKVVDFGVASFTDPQRLLDMQVTYHGPSRATESRGRVARLLALPCTARLSYAFPEPLLMCLATFTLWVCCSISSRVATFSSRPSRDGRRASQTRFCGRISPLPQTSIPSCACNLPPS